MIEYEWPWLLLLLPLPLLMRLLPAARPRDEAALRVPDLAPFAGAARIGRHGGRLTARGPLITALLAWALLTFAAARPVWLGAPIELPVSGRDLLLAVDISGSMETADFVLEGRRPVSRLVATQKVAGEFIGRRVGDRVGLILFGREAYLQTPLTFDRETVRRMLEEAAIGLAGKETAIGDAIGLAIKRLAAEPVESRVLVLLTDGANTAGEVSPERAARLAADEKVTIHTIGIGADEMVVRGLFGAQRVNPSRDLDEKSLRSIAELTGGRYFRARDRGELEQIYRVIDQLEPVEKERQTFRPRRALYPWPLAAAALLAALLLWQTTRPARLEAA